MRKNCFTYEVDVKFEGGEFPVGLERLGHRRRTLPLDLVIVEAQLLQSAQHAVVAEQRRQCLHTAIANIVAAQVEMHQLRASCADELCESLCAFFIDRWDLMGEVKFGAPCRLELTSCS